MIFGNFIVDSVLNDDKQPVVTLDSCSWVMDCDMTPQQARTLAQGLLDAADRADQMAKEHS